MARRIWIVASLAVLLTLAVGGIAWAQETTQVGETGATSPDPEAKHPPLLIRDRVVRGKVTDVRIGLASVETPEGENVTLLLTDNTHLWVPGEPPTTTVTLEIGDPVVALGEPAPEDEGERALAARLLVIASDEELPRIFVQGRTLVVTEETIVVHTGRGERAITIRPHTRLHSSQGPLPSLRSILPGNRIIAIGQPTELGQWIAGLVLVPDARPLARNGIRGEVTAIDLNDGTLKLSTVRRGEIAVLTDNQTRYRIPDIEKPGFADIQVGDMVMVVGRFEPGNETRLLARGIGVLPPREKEQ
jgi:hypothetical protein